MTSAPAIIRAPFHTRTAAERTAMFEDQGKGRRRVTGGYIDDLAALRKAIWLCQPECARKFNAKSYGYFTRASLPIVRGKCDGCGQHNNRCRMFIHRSTSYL